MNDRLKKLYQTVIVKHSKSPFHFEISEDLPHKIVSHNPLCGDIYNFFIKTIDNRINEISFHGYGCAISKASHSLLVKQILNKDLKNALHMCHYFLDYIDEFEPLNTSLDKELEAFSGVKYFPGRKECVTLGWSSMAEFLKSSLAEK